MADVPKQIDDIIKALGLRPLDQEGGWFRQTLKRVPEIEASLFGPGLPCGERPQMTAIQAVIGAKQFSAMHRLAIDEFWVFHMGAPLEMLMLHPDGSHETVVLGHDVLQGERLQHVVPSGVWQGSTARGGPSCYSVVSCIMTPGFVWEDFELGDPEELSRAYPNVSAKIAQLSRATPATGAR